MFKLPAILLGLVMGVAVFATLALAQDGGGSTASTTRFDFSLDPVVVIGTRDSQSISESTKSVSVVTKDEMDAQENTFLPRFLSQQPGVFYTTNGSPGQWTTINVRGAGAKYTTFQFNGIKLQDVADTQGAFTGFLEDLQGTSNIERLELLRGTSSALHGSRAIGGVISLQTERWIDGIRAEVRNEFGPNKTYIGNARIAYGKPDSFYIDVNPVYLDTDGEKYIGNFGLGYKNKGASVTGGFKPFEGASVEFVSLFYDSDMISSDSPTYKNYYVSAPSNNLKKSDLVPQRVTNPKDRRESMVAQVGAIWRQSVSDLWDYSFSISSGKTERHYFTEAIGGVDKDFYDGKTLNVQTQHNIKPTDWLTINTGIEFEELKYIGLQTPNSYIGEFTEKHEDYKYKSWEYFLQFQGSFINNKLKTNIGGRYSKYDMFSGEFLYDLSAAYLFDTGAKIHAQYGAGYRAPSLYELFGGGYWRGSYSHYGDASLKPEKSKSFEFGVEQSLNKDRIKIGATYFQIDVDDIIFFTNYPRPITNDYGYANGTNGKVKGLESWMNYWLLDNVRLAGSFTYVDSRYKKYKSDLVYTKTKNLPHKIYNFNVLAMPTDKLVLSGNLTVRGETPVDIYGPGDYDPTLNYNEKSFAVLDLAASYQPFEFMKIFLRLDNVTDEKYTIGGYFQPGFSVFGGVVFSYK
ncbi:MAG: TonB-dependent receptor [Deltaproteobacteria bacterium]|jgi:vitamin B12 transporter|nr:TonB-dependent receptor [Deltaproteobacteria bacterium]